MITIANNTVAAVISEKGAELQSLTLNGLEYLWQANEKFWGKHAPVLFPIVGELKDGRYIFENNEYKLSRHGFARDSVFEARKTSPASALFTLKSNAKTLAVYPFEFIFTIEYTLHANEILCNYSVENINSKTMYFSVGGHPAFNVPLQKQLQYTDYFLRFDKDDSLTRNLLQNGLLSGDSETINLHNKTLPLQHSLFYNDAIVLKHIASTRIDLMTDKDAHGLTLKFNEFPYFGIWAAKDAPFICLEPWCGIADNIYHSYKLKYKEGINELAAHESWSKTWSIELF